MASPQANYVNDYVTPHHMSVHIVFCYNQYYVLWLYFYLSFISCKMHFDLYVSLVKNNNY